VWYRGREGLRGSHPRIETIGECDAPYTEVEPGQIAAPISLGLACAPNSREAIVFQKMIWTRPHIVMHRDRSKSPDLYLNIYSCSAGRHTTRGGSGSSCIGALALMLILVLGLLLLGGAHS
jgi:hypothetical protein